MVTTIGACRQALVRAGALANINFITDALYQGTSDVKVKLAPN